MKGTRNGGRGGIRTHERLSPLAVFKTAAINRSATLPRSLIVRQRCHTGANRVELRVQQLLP